MNQNQFVLDKGFFGWFYRLLTPGEWLMTHILNLFHKFLVLVGMPSIGVSWILSIVLLVILVHACILPLFIRQMKSMRKMQALQPKMQHIQQKYKGKNDPASKEAMSREMTKLYQDNHANPAGSCLPMLIQGPVFMCMFYTLSVIPYIARGQHAALGAFDRATAENFSATTMFGLRVTTNFNEADTSGKILIGIFIVLMCAAMWYMQFNNMRKNLPRAQMEGQQYKVQQAMTWVFPLMYIFSGITFPFAVLVYWLSNNVLSMLRSLWQVYALPTPGSPAAEEKELRDYRRENERRKASGEISLEEEELVKAKEAAERRETEGFQRQQPQRKRRRK